MRSTALHRYDMSSTVCVHLIRRPSSEYCRHQSDTADKRRWTLDRTLIITFILHNQNAKATPSCDVSFANGELHQACGHVTLLI